MPLNTSQAHIVLFASASVINDGRSVLVIDLVWKIHDFIVNSNKKGD